jgi:hypothetical protein
MAQLILEEIDLLRCSLLPNEYLHYAIPEDSRWRDVLEKDASLVAGLEMNEPLAIELRVENARVRFEVSFPPGYPRMEPIVKVKGFDMGREEQVSWQDAVRQKMTDLEGHE